MDTPRDTTRDQSRVESFVEACANQSVSVLTGTFVISWMMGESPTQTVGVAAILSGLAVCRIYIIRRLSIWLRRKK